MTLEIRARVPGFDPDHFWQQPPGQEAWAAMVAKYAELSELAGVAEDARKPRLRAAASRWPGSLREGELIGPTRVAERARAAALGLASPGRTRASWPETPARAVLCWAVLHPLIDDLLRYRSAAASDQAGHRAGDPGSFASWLASEAEPVRVRWPEPEQIVALLGPKLRVRSAYLWLAAQAGLSLPSLNGLLLARAGHWDQRPEDPAWARTL
jgi:hypothetical protein